MKEFLSVLRDRNMGLLLSGRLVSAGGDWLYDIAISIAVFRYSHGNSGLVSLVWFFHLLPSMFLGPFTGALADRIGYRRSMIIADLGRMVLVGSLGFILSPSTYAIAFPLAVCIASFSNLFRPASAGLIPAIVPAGEKRLAANAAVGEVASIAMIAGSALGGVVAGLGGINQLLLIQAASFGISALSLSFIHLRPSAQATEDREAAGTEEPSRDEQQGLLAGLRLVSRRPLLVFAGTIMSVPQILSGATLIWIVPYSIHTLHMGNGGVGYLYCAIGAGSLIGGLIAAAIGSTARLQYLLMGGVVLFGASMVVFGLFAAAAVALGSMLVAGMAETVEIAAYDTLLQQAVPESMIGRAAGTMDTLFYNLIVVGTLASGLLAVWPGLQFAMIALGILSVGAALLGWWRLRREVALQPDAENLVRIPAFEQVPLPVREWAVQRMVREQFPAGAVVIRQGDQGDTFYTIASGKVRAEVAVDGRTMTNDLGPGDFFGEIALLQNVPRTATVRAVDELTVYALSRDDFEELQNRASQFKESLLEVARARLAEDTKRRISMTARG